MTTPFDDPILLTPGPLTTRIETRRAMLRDFGSRSPHFIALTAELRRRLLGVAKGEQSHVAIPLQGSGTFIVEAAIGSLVRPTDNLLVLINGAYGERIAKIATRLGRSVKVLNWEEDQAVDALAVDRALSADPAVTHVAVVHCETTSGILNPLEEVARVVATHGKALILDAMSSFGALEIDLVRTPIAAVLASSNKCLEGAPGLGFALVERSMIEAAKGVSPSISLDLYEQWRGLEANGQWRFTPPVQVVAALVEALHRLEAEGGPTGRLVRYRDNLKTIVDGMARLGFSLFLDPAVQAPIIATFRVPDGSQDRRFDFPSFYAGLAERGFLIYPGKLTRADSFRVGCIGAIDRSDLERFLRAAETVLGAQTGSATAAQT